MTSFDKTRSQKSSYRWTEEDLLSVKGRGVDAVTVDVDDVAVKPKSSKKKSTTSIIVASDNTASEEKQNKSQKGLVEEPSWTSPRTVKAKQRSGKSINTHVKDLSNSIKCAIVRTSVSEDHLSLVFEGARMLTLNEVISILPHQPYLVYSYKTAWKNKINEALYIAKNLYKKEVPEFSESCVFIGFRRSAKLVDRDGLPSCFKFILDDLRNQTSIPERILKDDNPNLIVDTPCYQAVGSPCVAIRLERVKNWQEPSVSESRILSLDPLAEHLSVSAKICS